jgi:chromosome segregation ATPase
VSRNDYLEALAEGSRPFMEMVKPQTQPLMETVATKRKVDGANIEKQPDTEFYPFIETVLTEVESVKLELEAVRAENQLLVSKKNQEISELNSRLAAANQKISELDDHTEDLESENQNLKSELASRPGENSVPIAIELPEAADLLNQLKGRLGKKCKAGLADIATILDILEGKR